jgi:hypothetical protein
MVTPEQELLNMAERTNLTGSVGRLKRAATTVAKAETKNQPASAPPRPVAPPIPAGGRGGKRSDPAYSPTTFFVRKETKKKAARILMDDAHAGKDLSDLVEELLGEWVSKQASV